MTERKKKTTPGGFKLSRPPHAAQTVSAALYVEDIEALDAAIERHNEAGGRASRSYVLRWLINYAEENDLWDEIPRRF